jgi:AraC-like DNA-binding protein
MVLLDHGGRDPREVEIVAPPADLAGMLEHSWVAHRTDALASAWRVVPDSSPHLIAMVTARAQRRAIRVVVVGARSRAADIDVRDRILTVGLRLRHGALPILTKASAREFVDRAFPVEDVFATSVLRDLELGADAPASLILQQLIQLARRTCRRGAVSTPMFDSASAVRVADLACLLQTPTRSLRERAWREVGLSPKRMLRVRRLHAALHAARDRRHSWSEIAYTTGFADQAHLARELRALLGEPPSAWAARGSAVSFKTPGPDGR